MSLSNTYSAGVACAPPPSYTRNELFDRLGRQAAGRLVSAGRRVVYAMGDTLWVDGDAVTHVLFIERGLVSLQWGDVDGGTADVDMIGAEGALGLAEALAGARFEFGVRAELPTEGVLVPAEALRELVEGDPAALKTFWAYTTEAQGRMRRGVGCASRHSARMRLADYLVSVDASAPYGRLRITQEMLAGALGVYRTTVTALLAQFADEALITAGRGWLMIVNRKGLERVACGCRRLEHRPHAAD